MIGVAKAHVRMIDKAVEEGERARDNASEDEKPRYHSIIQEFHMSKRHIREHIERFYDACCVQRFVPVIESHSEHCHNALEASRKLAELSGLRRQSDEYQAQNQRQASLF